MNSRSLMRNMIAGLFPKWVGLWVASPDACFGDLPDAEEVHVVGAIPKRRREFVAGRFCARQALAQIGVPGVSLPPRADRSPLWPPGVVGTISHCSDVAVAAVARREHAIGLGVDVERSGRVGERLLADIATGDEQQRLRDLRRRIHVDWSTLLFSAKESFYKSYHPLVGQALDFQDVEVEFDLVDQTFVARVVNPERPALAGRMTIQGRFASDATHVTTGLTIHKHAVYR